MKKYIIKPIASPDKKLNIDYKSELNDEQYRVVTEGDGPCLVLAGAGSGKTRTLVYRVAYLLENGIKPERILLMTFTNKASKEMLSRVELILKNKPQGLWGGTFHHIGNRLLRMYGKKININPSFNILDEEDAKGLIKSCLHSLDISRDKYFPKADLIKKIISLSANLNQPIHKIIEERFSYLADEHIPIMTAIAAAYQERKNQSQSLDFDDLLYKWNELLVASPEIKEKLAQKFQYILVDEYQDTNFIQGELIKNLSGESNNILAVGDDSQSIYSFRGATVKNILNFPKHFPQAKIFKLETNYRSTPEILQLANASIKNNPNQFEKKLKTQKPSSVKPALVTPYDNYQQAEFICQRIMELQQEEGINLNEMAVLFRAHSQSLELEMELNKRNIPYVMRGGLRFFEQAHIKDVLAYLRILNNYLDEISWTRLLHLQPGIGESNAKRIWQIISSCGDLKQVQKTDFTKIIGGRAATGWYQLNEIFEKLLVIDPGQVSELILQILKSGYLNHLIANYENGEERAEDLKQLMNFASSYKSLDEFLSDAALSEGFKSERIAGQKNGPEEALTLSTVHQAKGLEWKVVFVVGLTEGQFPHAKVYEFPDQLAEERRLFYVASTRAKDQLYLTAPMIGGRGDILSRASQFIQELPGDVYERWQTEEDITYEAEDGGEFSDEEGDKKSILDIYLKNRKLDL